jgi:hypothetical protein
VLSIALLSPTFDAHAELNAYFESPAADETVAGVLLIRGWAYDTVSGVQISSVELFIDDVLQGNIACCTTRGDVQAAFPNDANAENSGFGLTINWGELSAGPHTIRVEVRTTAGETFVSDTRNITVVRLGDFSFLNQFNADVNQAFAQVEEDNTICVENVEITDKSSGTTKFVKGIFRWQEACQCLILISTEEEGYCDF